MRRIAPLFALAFVSAFTAEFLLGDQYLSPAGAGQQIGMVIFFMAFYGAGAILIRESCRRLGVGWPGMVIMAFGFGVFEEGLLTQSLFNPHYLGLDLLAPGFVPALGIALPWTIYVITLHVIWSMSSPIALFEALFGRRVRLRRIGLVVTAVIFVIGSAATFATSYFLSPQRFLASPYQLATAAVITVLAVVLAVRLPRAHASSEHAPESARRLVLGVVVGAVGTTAFQVGRRVFDGGVPAWVPTVTMLAVLAVGIVSALRLRLSPTGLAVGAVLTYGWVGIRAALQAHVGTDLLEQAVIVLGYLVLLGAVLRRSSRPRSTPAAPQSLDSSASTGR